MNDFSHPKSGFLQRSEWVAAGLTALAAGLVYWLTLSPSIPPAYCSGQLLVAADYFGVGRPPGYPVWTLLAGLATKIFPFHYHGYPNPAYAVNLLSAFFGALTAGEIALLVGRGGRLLFSSETRGASLNGAVAGFAAGLCFALGRIVWSQAVIAETHTLTSFLIVLVLLFGLRWVEGWSPGRWVLAFLFGFGVAATPFFVVMGPVLLAVAAWVSKREFRAWIAATLMWAIWFCWGRYLLRFGMSPTLWGLLAVAVLFGSTAIFSRSSRPAAAIFGLVLLGMLPILYLPLAASFNPPMNSGDARTWEGFLHVISRGQYERLVFVDVFSLRYLQQLGGYLNLLAVQFTWPIASIGLVPCLFFPRFSPRGRRWFGVMGLGFIVASAGVMTGVNPSLDLQTMLVAQVFFIASFVYYAVFIGWGLLLLLHNLKHRL
ncbi:MAG TPA: hypothetical protein DCZ95_04540 [Verrucomicrobia bacterium]|nr:MAG: hypothetical protein A2X46_17715 [Lentisphaerae bacterium GWF2_57_35]HBA83345.1 hypothetical protein [Verrucomicrobiota bacterium]